MPEMTLIFGRLLKIFLFSGFVWRILVADIVDVVWKKKLRCSIGWAVSILFTPLIVKALLASLASISDVITSNSTPLILEQNATNEYRGV